MFDIDRAFSCLFYSLLPPFISLCLSFLQMKSGKLGLYLVTKRQSWGEKALVEKSWGYLWQGVTTPSVDHQPLEYLWCGKNNCLSCCFQFLLQSNTVIISTLNIVINILLAHLKLIVSMKKWERKLILWEAKWLAHSLQVQSMAVLMSKVVLFPGSQVLSGVWDCPCNLVGGGIEASLWKNGCVCVFCHDWGVVLAFSRWSSNDECSAMHRTIPHNEESSFEYWFLWKMQSQIKPLRIMCSPTQNWEQG